MTKRMKLKEWNEIPFKDRYKIETLNRIYAPLDFVMRVHLFYQMFDVKDVLYTSSFGTNAAVLLDIVHDATPSQTVHFIDTTYHFEETIAYKLTLTEKYGMNVIDVLPNQTQNELTREEQWWIDHPKMCCTINKVASLDPIIAKHKLWISGLIAYQTKFRFQLNIFEQQGDIIKFHPLLDVGEGDILFWAPLLTSERM